METHHQLPGIGSLIRGESAPRYRGAVPRWGGWTLSPAGHTAEVREGDFILCHRTGFASSAIDWFTRSKWSHAAYCRSSSLLVEALTKGVTKTPLAAYHDVVYLHVATNLDNHDVIQASHFIDTCIGRQYGWGTIAGIFLRQLHFPSFMAASGTPICSGLVAEALTRGPAVFSIEPGDLDPAQLADEYGAPRSPREAWSRVC